MKYYIVEGIADGQYNASSKARTDVETIMKKNNVSKLTVGTKVGVEKSAFLKWKQYITYLSNYFVWIKTLSRLKCNDVVFIQYPLNNVTLFFDKIIKKFRKKGIIFITVIHDLNSLRFLPKVNGKFLYKRVCKEDRCILNEVNFIISHNDVMKKELMNLGNDERKIVTLELFDYLLNNDKIKSEKNKNLPVIIAGNLSYEKAKYLYSLNKLNTKFNLYGVGYNEYDNNNIFYKGKYKPEELVDNLSGSFGLIWDGESIETCFGGYGEYLRYNNPHKASLYLTAGFPIIVWEDSAISEFVTSNGLGFSIKKLKDIDKIISKLSDEDYNKMLKNVKKISKKTINGEFLQTAMDKVYKKINLEERNEKGNNF